MSGHLVVTDTASARTILAEAQEALKTGFGLTHVTIQIEDEALEGAEAKRPF